MTLADPIEAGYWHSVLESRGIRCLLKNDYLGGGVGELPLNECWPEIWVLDPRDEPLARRIINEQRSPQKGQRWQCPRCQEVLEPQFTQCWQCGENRAD